jgi:hypothetical protein
MRIRMIRVQAVVLPLLRALLPGVQVSSWIPDIDYRTFPLVLVRRTGGIHHPRYNDLSLPVIELSAFSREGLVETEELYETALLALYASVSDQTIVPGSPGATFTRFWRRRGPLRPLRCSRIPGWFGETSSLGYGQLGSTDIGYSVPFSVANSTSKKACVVPPLDPPGVIDGDHGFTVGPNS